MTPRPLTDAQLAAGLRAYLPVAQAGMHDRILAAITTTPQERRLPSILGRLTDADPMARRRMILVAALVALAFAASMAAIAGALLREQRTPDLSLDPPTDLPAFVRSAYDDMAKLQPMTITALRDGTTKIRISVGGSGATRIDEFTSIDATEPASYKIFAGTTVGELANTGDTRVWYEQSDAIFEDPRVFVYGSLAEARTTSTPGCEISVSPGEEYSGIPGRGWRYVALEYVAGRPAHHVQCGDDLWIDVETRLILRSRAASTGADSVPARVAAVEVTSVELGQPPSELFEIRQPQGVAAITPEEYQEYECSLNPICSASPAPVVTPPPADAEPATVGDAVVAAALEATDELATFDVVVENSGARVPKNSDRIIADGSGRFRIERWSDDYPVRTIELIGPDRSYGTDQLADGTQVWRERKRLTQRELPTYPIELPTTCDAGWDVMGVDEIRGRIADHIRCGSIDSSEYWIDRETHLAVRVVGTPDPASGWEASEVVELRLGESPAELFELPPDVPPFPPTPDAGEVVPGWPDTSENAAGVYSWDGSTCSSTSCVIGFMHNGYGSGDVRISIQLVPAEPIAGDGATAVTVAGHDGTYRRINARLEQWIVAIEGTTVAIKLESRPGVSKADLDEAHAMIETLRTEARDNDLGFMLVFTLATDDWDSG